MKYTTFNTAHIDHAFDEVGWVQDWWSALTIQFNRLTSSWFTYIVLLTVLMVDSGLLGLHLAYDYARLDGTQLPSWFDLSTEGSLGELFEYIMTGAGGLCLAMLAIRHRSGTACLIAALMFYITIDNSMELHEVIGGYLGQYIGPVGPLGSGAAGELMALSIFGFAVLIALFLSLRGEATPLKAGGGIIIGLIIAAAFFAVGIDALHAMVPHDKIFLNLAASGIEDGGELICFTLAGAVCMMMLAANRREAAD